MNVSVLAVTILGPFRWRAVRLCALAYNLAVIFTLNQDSQISRAAAARIDARLLHPMPNRRLRQT
jgi:hypothetical protein